MAVSGQTVLIALAIDFGIGLGAFIIFSILRIIKPTNRYYDPRTFYGHTLGGVHAATGTATAGTANNLQPSSAAVQQSSENAEQWLSQDPSALSNTDSTGSAHTDVAAVENQSFQERNDSTNTLQAAANTQGLTAAALSSSGPPPPDEGGMPRPGGPLPPRLPGTLLTWIVPLLQLSEARVVATVGLDVAMLLRFIRFALRVLVLVIIWCVGVVLPINYTGTNLITAEQIQEATASVPTTPAISAPPTVVNDNFLGQLIPTITVPGIGNSTNTTGGSGGGAGAARVQLGPGEDVTSLAEQIESGRYVASDLDRFSMANIPAGSPLLWVHLASVYVVTAITLKLLWSATSDALQLYLHHLSSNSANLDSATHTALLTDIPGVSKGTLPDKVHLQETCTRLWHHAGYTGQVTVGSGNQHSTPNPADHTAWRSPCVKFIVRGTKWQGNAQCVLLNDVVTLGLAHVQHTAWARFVLGVKLFSCQHLSTQAGATPSKC
eukprot:GHRR01015146.1.p1 GENE.GHRR01015146.1~~GHRR01015146.1.p1  ORF type:complete len:493 (+),score=106.27 GHRR01015146.1:103-1581(+)